MVGRLGLFFYYFYETQQKFAYYEKIALKSANIFVIRNSNKFKIFGKQEICIPKFLKKFEARFFLMTFAHFSLRTHEFLWKKFSTLFLEGHFPLKHEIAWGKKSARKRLKHKITWSMKTLEGLEAQNHLKEKSWQFYSKIIAWTFLKLAKITDKRYRLDLTKCPINSHILGVYLHIGQK